MEKSEFTSDFENKSFYISSWGSCGAHKIFGFLQRVIFLHKKLKDNKTVIYDLPTNTAGYQNIVIKCYHSKQ